MAGVKRETFPGRLVQGTPNVLANARLSLDCGCHVFVGMRMDTQGPATAVSACGMRHRKLVERFLELLSSYPYKPGEAKPLVVHVEELLLEAESESSSVRRTA